MPEEIGLVNLSRPRAIAACEPGRANGYVPPCPMSVLAASFQTKGQSNPTFISATASNL